MQLARLLAYGFLTLTAFSAPVAAVEPGAPERLISRVDAVGAKMQQQLSAKFRKASKSEKELRGALVEYYFEHGNQPIWIDGNGLNSKAVAVIEEFKRAESYGLKSRDYEVPLAEGVKSARGDKVKRLAEVELEMSRAVLTYASHARMGRPQVYGLSRNYDPTDDLPEFAEILGKFAKADDPKPYLLEFHPKHPQFAALREMLNESRGGAEPKRHIHVSDGPVLNPGDRHRTVGQLRQRLGMAIPQGDGEADLYDAALVQAVKDFQKQKGLATDGVVGPGTKSVMNRRPRNRTKAILVNMERWRWLPHDLGSFHVRVNVPEAMVRVSDNGRNVLTERVVVGKPGYQTPVFSGEMDHIVFHPYWNVPNSIKIQEILPGLRGGGGFFSSRPRIMRMYDLHVKYRGREINANSVNWSRSNITQYHFYQKPGGLNVLGSVKFMFPNKHDVYLHDTQEKFYFNRTYRAESHGCVRVQNPRRLAEVLLRKDRGWSTGRTGSAFASGHNHRVNLNKKVPVHITYFTAWVDERGKLRTYGDLYGHDNRMASAMRL
jgi:murein L,D-transpeptidase YcbB/YkuD